jgi:uncharacterized protein (TIGR02246 family)
MSRQIAAGLAGLAIIALSSPTPAQARNTEVCQSITKQQVAGLFDHWNHALGTRKTEQVVAAYTPDATLLPTVQDGPLVGPAEIGKYFTYFLKQSPAATIETRIIHTGCNVAYDIGVYDFQVDGDQPGARKQVKARYTFVYVPVHGKWLIAHHHSSVLPEPPR